MKRILRVLAIVAAVLILAAIALPFLIDANTFRPTLEERLTAALGREVKLGNLKLSVLSGSFTADDLSIADDPAFGKTPFLRAKSLSVGVELYPLISSRKLIVTGITIDQPEVNLVQTPKGEWNFATLGDKPVQEPKPASSAPAPANGQPLDLSVKLVRINNGRFTLGSTRPKAQRQQLEKINIEVGDFSVNSPFTFSLAASVIGGGEIKLKGKAGPIPEDVSTTPFDASLSINALDVVHAGFLPPSTGIAGLISIDGKAASDGNLVKVSGKFKADNLKLVQTGSPAKRPVELDLAVAHDMHKRGGTLERSAVRIGKAEAHLSGVYDLANEIPAIKMKLDGPKMPLAELTSILPALDVVLPGGSSIEGGTASADLSSEGSLDHLVTTGTLSVDKTRLANYDLGSKMRLLERFAGVPATVNTDIDILSAGVTTRSEGTEIRDLNLIVPTIGSLTGAGTISPKHDLAFKMRAALRTAGAANVALAAADGVGVPFRIEGTSETPAFKADVKGMVGEMVKDPQKAVDAAKGILNMFK